MIDLRELCGTFDPAKVVAASKSHISYFVVNRTVYKKSQELEKWAHLDFEPLSIVINNPGSLVAFAGESKVQVFSNDSKLQFSESFPKGVRKVLFHPLGVDGTCLVVLSAGHVRTLWLSPTGHEKYTFDFGRNAVGSHDGPQYATSMTFGPPDSPTGPLTLYLSTEEGNIFAISPFLPSKFQMTESQLGKLLDSAASLYYAHQTLPDADVYKQHFEWAKSIELQNVTPKLKDGVKVYKFDAPEPSSLCSQGAFRVNPYPEELYDTDFVDITSFSYQDLHFLVQTTSNFLAFLLLDEPTPGYWTVSKTPEYDPNVALVQLMRVSGSPRLQVTNNLIWGHTSAATTLYEPIWIRALEESLESGATRRLEAAKVTVLARSVVSEGLFAAEATAINDFDSHKEFRYIVSNNTPTLGQDESQGAQKYAYTNETAASITSLLKDIKLEPCGPIVGVIKDDLKSIEKMDKIADAYTNELAKLYKCISLAFDALNFQRIELHRQLKFASSLSSDITNLGDKDRKKLLSEALERQKKIQERASTIAKRLADEASLDRPIGRQEQRWFKELDGVEKTTDDYLVRANAAESSFSGVVPSSNTTSNLKAHDLRALLTKLTNLGKEINRMESKLHLTT